MTLALRLAATAAIAAGLAAPVPALAAAGAVDTSSAVYVERGDGASGRAIEPASRLERGDRVITVVSWQRRAGSGQFVITNRMPRALAYEDSASEAQEVSVDGGRTWGRLGSLRTAGRLATADDVTDVRWRVAAGATRGNFAYSGIVR